MSPKIRQQVRVMRACKSCATHKKKCDHKVAVYLPRKGVTPDPKQRTVESADETMSDTPSDRGTKANKRKAPQVEEEVPGPERSVRRRGLRAGRVSFMSGAAGQDSDGGRNSKGSNAGDLSSASAGHLGDESPSRRSISLPAIEIASPTPSIAPEVETRGSSESPSGDDTEEGDICVRPPLAPSPPPTRSQLPSSNASPAPRSLPPAASTGLMTPQGYIQSPCRWIDYTKPASRFSAPRRYTTPPPNAPIYGGRVPPPAPTPPPASR